MSSNKFSRLYKVVCTGTLYRFLQYAFSVKSTALASGKAHVKQAEPFRPAKSSMLPENATRERGRRPNHQVPRTLPPPPCARVCPTSPASRPSSRPAVGGGLRRLWSREERGVRARCYSPCSLSFIPLSSSSKHRC